MRCLYTYNKSVVEIVSVGYVYIMGRISLIYRFAFDDNTMCNQLFLNVLDGLEVSSLYFFSFVPWC